MVVSLVYMPPFLAVNGRLSVRGFSVGFCINVKRLSVTNFSLKNNFLMFRLNALVIIRVKVKEVRTNVAIFIAMHY